MRCHIAISILSILGAAKLSAVAAHNDESLSARMQEFAANQQPVAKMYVHPMRYGRKWDTKTPKLENGSDKLRRHNKRQASVTFTQTATATTSTGTPTATLSPDRIDTSVYKAGLAWTSGSGSDWEDFLPDSSTVTKRRIGGARLSKRLAGSVVGWTYDWSSQIVPGTPLERLDFVPMAWGTGSVDSFAADSANFRAWGVSHLLSFNEPDQPFSAGGSDITPSVAATYHQLIFNSTLAAEYSIGSPAVARGGKAWLQEWVAACAGNCAYDFVPLHFYGRSAALMIAYIEDFIATFGKPVWVTEYACVDYGVNPAYICTLEETEAFERQVLEYMYPNAQVQRYAAFGAFLSWADDGNPNALIDTQGRITELGRLYATTT